MKSTPALCHYTWESEPTEPRKRYFDLSSSLEHTCLPGEVEKCSKSIPPESGFICSSEGRQSPCWLVFVGVWD